MRQKKKLLQKLRESNLSKRLLLRLKESDRRKRPLRPRELDLNKKLLPLQRQKLRELELKKKKLLL